MAQVLIECSKYLSKKGIRDVGAIRLDRSQALLTQLVAYAGPEERRHGRVHDFAPPLPPMATLPSMEEISLDVLDVRVESGYHPYLEFGVSLPESDCDKGVVARLLRHAAALIGQLGAGVFVQDLFVNREFDDEGLPWPSLTVYVSAHD
ncbi:hypothetical protein ACSDQ9_01630 [Aestuariimicrobium soli]|uniref:hypothetical protein n=1 Tax=Aestuariimicrobium soli TaxID=2035834 RepID=UPI003EBDF67B